MNFDFVLRGLPGCVDVTLVPNDNPAALGCRHEECRPTHWTLMDARWTSNQRERVKSGNRTSGRARDGDV
jgi:hypothetical protein